MGTFFELGKGKAAKGEEWAPPFTSSARPQDTVGLYPPHTAPTAFRLWETLTFLTADLFLFCYERDFMVSLSGGNQADVIEAFNSTSRYLDDLLNIDNPYFEGMVS